MSNNPGLQVLEQRAILSRDAFVHIVLALDAYARIAQHVGEQAHADASYAMLHEIDNEADVSGLDHQQPQAIDTLLENLP